MQTEELSEFPSCFATAEGQIIRVRVGHPEVNGVREIERLCAEHDVHSFHMIVLLKRRVELSKAQPAQMWIRARFIAKSTAGFIRTNDNGLFDYY